jgi:hypothetical protein
MFSPSMSGISIPSMSGISIPSTSGIFIPSSGRSVLSSGGSIPPSGRSIPPSGRSVPSSGRSVPSSGRSIPSSGRSIPPSGRSVYRILLYSGRAGDRGQGLLNSSSVQATGTISIFIPWVLSPRPTVRGHRHRGRGGARYRVGG